MITSTFLSPYDWAVLNKTYIPLNIRSTVTANYSVEGICVLGNYIYTVTPDIGKLSCYSIGTPSSPQFLGSLTDMTNLNGCEGVEVNVIGANTYAFIGAYESNKMTIVDVTNPSNPVLKGSVTSAQMNGPTWAIQSGNYCFVSVYGHENFDNSSHMVNGAIVALDISNLAAPYQVGYVSNTYLAGCETTVKVGNYLYCACAWSLTGTTGGGVVIVNVSNPVAPVVSGQYTHALLKGCEGIAVSGNYAYAVAGYGSNSFFVIDISNPSAPSHVAHIQDFTYLNGPHEVIIIGNYAYVSAIYYDGVTVVDISNPASPTIVAYVADTGLLGCSRLTSKNGYLYVTGYDSGKLVTIGGDDWTAVQTKAETYAQWFYDCDIGKTNETAIMFSLSYRPSDMTNEAVYERTALGYMITALKNKGLKYGLSIGSKNTVGVFFDDPSNFTAAYTEIEAEIDYFYSQGYFSAGADNIWWLGDIFYADWFSTNATRMTYVRQYYWNVISKAYAKKGTSGTMYLTCGFGMLDYSLDTSSSMTSWLNTIYTSGAVASKNMKMFFMCSDMVASDTTGNTLPGGPSYSSMLSRLASFQTTVNNSTGGAAGKFFFKVNAEQWVPGSATYAAFSRIQNQMTYEDGYSYQGIGPVWVMGNWMSAGFDDTAFRTSYKTTYFSGVTETITGPASAPTGTQNASQGSSYAYTSATATSNLGHSVEYQFDWKGDASDLSSWGAISQNKTWTTSGSFSVKSRARCVADTSIVGSWTSGLAVTVVAATGSNYAYSTNLLTWTLESKNPCYKILDIETGHALWTRETSQISNEDSLSSGHLGPCFSINGLGQSSDSELRKNSLLGSYHNYYITVETETVSNPANVTGPSTGSSGSTLSFTSDSCTSSLGHAVEYQFNFGDVEPDTWGAVSQNKIYSTVGTYKVKSRARCATDIGIVSAWSSEKTVTVT